MWNADIYDRYGKERIQPSIDLANRIQKKECYRILDVGCGTGMSTLPLATIWKDAEIIGVDLSEEMLQKARETLPAITFLQRDCSTSLSDLGTFDLIFSNAFLQWIPKQEDFIAESFAMLKDNGVFATQLPLFHEMPAHQCIKDAEAIMAEKFIGIEADSYVLHSASEYYDMLSNVTTKCSIWVTEYYHEMKHHQQVLDFLKGAALRPYLDRLQEQEQSTFLKEVLHNLERAYPCQKNGTILFPFKRLFLIGEK